jgi:NADPH-dependent 2,4-dienoyl-CoA reductase/sulfur reductase-like enzyme
VDHGLLLAQDRLMAFAPERMVGNGALARFDVCVIGSGSGASAATEVLARSGQRVLVLETDPLVEPGSFRPPRRTASEPTSAT